MSANALSSTLTEEELDVGMVLIPRGVCPDPGGMLVAKYSARNRLFDMRKTFCKSRSNLSAYATTLAIARAPRRQRFTPPPHARTISRNCGVRQSASAKPAMRAKVAAGR